MFKPVNRVIKFLIASNFFLYSAWGFVMPIFAIFIIQNIKVDSPAEAAKIAGFAFFTYWFVKSTMQIPISLFLDARHGEKDDFWFMILGLIITGIAPLGFLISKLPWHVYTFEAMHAIGMALVIPSWNAIFTRHMDRGREAFEWAMDSTFLGFGVAITGAVGGLVAATFGFTFLFIAVALVNFFAAFVTILVHKDILPKDHILSWLPRPGPF